MHLLCVKVISCINHSCQISPDLARNKFILIKVYTDENGMKYLYHGLSTCTGDNPLAKARGLSPRTGGQTVV